MHPNVKVVAIFDEHVTGWKGTHQAFQVREFQDQGLLFAAVNLPPSILAMSFPHRGAALGELMQHYDRMVLAGMLCEDTTTGRVRTIDGRPQAFYQLNDADAANLKRGTVLLSELLFAAGARRIFCRSTTRRAARPRRGPRACSIATSRPAAGGRHRPHDGHRADGQRSQRRGHRAASAWSTTPIA